MRITVVEQNGSGGLLHYAYQLCTALADAGHEVTLVTARLYELQSFPHNFHVENRLDLWTIYRQDIPVVRLNRLQKILAKIAWETRRAFRALKLIAAWFDLCGYLTRTRPDVVLFGSLNYPFETIFLNYLRKKGLLLSQICHEFERRESRNSLTALFEKSLGNIYEQFSVVFFHAQSYRDRFLTAYNYPIERTCLIQHGNEDIFLKHAANLAAPVDLRQRYGLSADEPVILFFGLLAPSKGIPFLIQSFKPVADRTRAKLIIAGYPTKRVQIGELIQLAEQVGCSDRIIFDPRYIPLGEVPQLMELATAVVLPYRNNTQSGALQVAYSFGKPVIASRVGGLAEAVQDGQSGYLADPEDQTTFSEKMIHLIEHPETARQMGRHARHLSETIYNWRTVAETITTRYAALLPEDIQMTTLGFKGSKASPPFQGVIASPPFQGGVGGDSSSQSNSTDSNKQ